MTQTLSAVLARAYPLSPPELEAMAMTYPRQSLARKVCRWMHDEQLGNALVEAVGLPPRYQPPPVVIDPASAPWRPHRKSVCAALSLALADGQPHLAEELATELRAKLRTIQTYAMRLRKDGHDIVSYRRGRSVTYQWRRPTS